MYITIHRHPPIGYNKMIKKTRQYDQNSVSDPIHLTLEKVAYEKAPHIRILLRQYSAESDLWHCHKDFWELVLVLSGKAINETETGRIHLSSGDLFVMPPGSVHHYVSINQFRHYILLLRPEVLLNFPGNFEQLRNFGKLFQSTQSSSPLLKIGENDMHEAIDKLEKASLEYMARNPGWQEALYTESFRALIFLLRCAHSAEEKVNSANYQISKAVRYMEENAAGKLTLKTLSAVAKMSVSNFRLRFREIMGFSPIDYLIRLRLKRAAILIACTDQPISEILLQTGFSDGSYFARQFHAAFKMTAQQFRRRFATGKIYPSEEIRSVLDSSLFENKK